MLPLARWEMPRATWRVPAADQLIAPRCEVVLPTLKEGSTEQRFSADDREIIGLAQILVKSDIAVVEDWEKSGRDATKYLLLTLERWVRDLAKRQSSAALIWVLLSATDWSTTRMNEDKRVRFT